MSGARGRPAPNERLVSLALECEALTTGDFTLENGEKRSYFFNTGAFATGDALARLAELYADVIEASEIAFDMLYGPAYKGIPLAASLAIALDARNGRTTPYTFDRKEPKSHGDGGAYVGAELRGRVLIVDDVITSGRAARDAMRRIAEAGAVPAGIAVALDREECGDGGRCRTVAERLEERERLPVVPVARASELREIVRQDPERKPLADAIESDLERYGAKDGRTTE